MPSTLWGAWWAIIPWSVCAIGCALTAYYVQTKRSRPFHPLGVGNTPVIRLLTCNGNHIYLKLDYFNVTQSTKDRICHAFVRHALEHGYDTLVEGSSASLLHKTPHSEHDAILYDRN